MKSSINWLKIISFLGMGLSLAGSIISDYASQKQNSEDIAEQVKEEVKKYFKEDYVA